MKPQAERLDWLERYALSNYGLSVLDAALVDAYAAANDVPVVVKHWGANGCPQLGRDLLALHERGVFTRCRMGLGSAWRPGFPTWVWSYDSYERKLRERADQ